MSPHSLLRRALASAALILTTLVSLPALTPSLRAATIEYDLQQGLHYLRTSDLAADSAIVEKTLAARAALVLDLRHAASDDESAATLSRLISRAPTSARFARLILVSRNTAPALLKQLATPHPGVVTLSAQTEGLTPDISVGTTPQDDTLAYEALTDGLALDKLLSGSAPQKVRYDEASLVRDHANGGNGNHRSSSADDAESEPSASETVPPEGSTNAPALNTTKPAPHPVDRVLLRAVQLHRTLLALKKL